MNQTCPLNVIVLIATKYKTIPSGKNFNFYILISIVYPLNWNSFYCKTNASQLKLMNPNLIHRFEQWTRYWNLQCHYWNGPLKDVVKSLSYGHKPNVCRYIESTYIDNFFPKSKTILVVVLLRPPNKPEFIRVS